MYGEASIQCGECRCVKLGRSYILDCEDLNMDYMPEIGDIIQRHITKAYMSGNMISSLNRKYFMHWYSLEFIDLSRNPNLFCHEVENIPEHVKVKMDCVGGTSGEYNNSIFTYYYYYNVHIYFE